METLPYDDAADEARARLALLKALAERDYVFVTPTPATCRRMVERAQGRPTLQDIFGWSLAFDAADLDPYLLDCLRRAGALEQTAAGLRSQVRISTLHGFAFLHSAFPTTAADSVFLGPDSYRFADFLASELRDGRPVGHVVDVGSGAGVGGLVALRATGAGRLTLTDINPKAHLLAAANLAHAGVEADLRLTSGLDGVPGDLDLVVANPPYIAGRSGRTYRDGGDLHGARLSLDWAIAGMERLARGGRVMIYTGSSILRGGHDQFRAALADAASRKACTLRYRELDPDVFGDELHGPEYRDVERIAAVGAVLQAPA